MTWLLPSEFETAVKIERREGGAGFFALLIAVYIKDDEYARAISSYWPEIFDGRRDFHHRAAHTIVDEYKRVRSIVLLAAAALHADSENQRKIERICPGLNAELSIRYNTPGSLIPGETLVVDGKTYKCVEVLSEGFGKYMVVEVANE